MKEDQRVALTRRLLQEGLIRLLEQKSIDKISVSELCSESGINRATFYRHYGQPRDILREIRSRIIADVTEIADRDQAQHNLRQWLEDICRYFYQQRQSLCLLFQTRTDEEFAEVVNQLYRQQLSLLENRGAANQDMDCMKLTAYGYAGGFYYILRQWLLEPMAKSAEEVADVMYRFLTGS